MTSYEVKSRNRFVCSVLALLISLLPIRILAQTDVGLRVIDASAIPYMQFLSKADFDQRFPGQIQSDLSDLDSGWYVIYVHEKLNYYFGPILLESTGQDYLMQLTQIVEAAIEQRPGIKGYQLALGYEPSNGLSGSIGQSGGSAGDSGSGSGIGDAPPPSPPSPPQPSGFWGFIRRIFGF